jgi:hypothetical protein
LEENFGSNLLVEKEFNATSPVSHTTLPHREKSHEVVKSTSRRKSYNRHENEQNINQLRKSRSPKAKTENEEKVKSSSPAR